MDERRLKLVAIDDRAVPEGPEDRLRNSLAIFMGCDPKLPVPSASGNSGIKRRIEHAAIMAEAVAQLVEQAEAERQAAMQELML